MLAYTRARAGGPNRTCSLEPLLRVAGVISADETELGTRWSFVIAVEETITFNTTNNPNSGAKKECYVKDPIMPAMYPKRIHEGKEVCYAITLWSKHNVQQSKCLQRHLPKRDTPNLRYIHESSQMKSTRSFLGGQIVGRHLAAQTRGHGAREQARLK